jgi:hypothetical protein
MWKQGEHTLVTGGDGFPAWLVMGKKNPQEMSDRFAFLRALQGLTRAYLGMLFVFNFSCLRAPSSSQAVAQAPASLLAAHAKDWVPLFLAYIAAKTGGGANEAAGDGGDSGEPQLGGSGRDNGVSMVSAIGGRWETLHRCQTLNPKP